jgi:hypothetical protein
MALRISRVGLVTVSLRKSITAYPWMSWYFFFNSFSFARYWRR